MTARKTFPTPPLQNGDRLSRPEFERRYHAMPHVKKAELIEGEVHMPSPVSWAYHADQDDQLTTFARRYSRRTPGVGTGGNATVKLDNDNEPQPDRTLFIMPAAGGRVVIDVDGYIVGSPELVAEVSASTASIDLGKKLTAYRRNGVGEYIVWRVYDDELDWFVFRDGEFVRHTPDPVDGLYKSVGFPGLWLDAAALLAGDEDAVDAALDRGLASPEHAAFAAGLKAKLG